MMLSMEIMFHFIFYASSFAIHIFFVLLLENNLHMIQSIYFIESENYLKVNRKPFKIWRSNLFVG